jgi:hypothetical protein
VSKLWHKNASRAQCQVRIQDQHFIDILKFCHLKDIFCCATVFCYSLATALCFILFLVAIYSFTPLTMTTALFTRDHSINEAVQLSRRSSIMRRSKTESARSNRSKRRSFVNIFQRSHPVCVTIDRELYFNDSKMNDENTFVSDVASKLSDEHSNFFDAHPRPALKRVRGSNSFQEWVQSFQRSPTKKPRRLHFKWFTNSPISSDELKSSELAVGEQCKFSKDALPDEAVSCYNQFKVQNFDELFTSESKSQQNSADNNKDDISVPDYYPLNDLSYDHLQRLREQIFSVPGFSFSGDEFDEGFQEKRSLLDLLFCVATSTDSSAAATENELLSDGYSGNMDAKDVPREVQDLFVETSDSPRISAPQRALQEANNEHDQSDFTDCIKSPDSEIIAPSHKEAPLSSPIQHDLNSVSVSPLSPNSASSILKKVKSVIRGAHRVESAGVSLSGETISHFSQSDVSRPESSASNYSPVTILVPTVRNQTLIAELTDNILDGWAIDKIYHPEDQCEDDENTRFDITDPSFFDYPQSQSTSQVNANIPTIRFDDFSQVMFYNGSGILQTHGEKSCNELLSLRLEVCKMRGTFVLESPETSQVNQRARLADSTVRLLSDANFCTEWEDSEASISYSLKSILKSTVNKNAENESMRITKLDKLDIWDFMEDFHIREKERMEVAPMLDSVREKQLDFYYNEVVQHNEKRVDQLDSLQGEGTTLYLPVIGLQCKIGGTYQQL